MNNAQNLLLNVSWSESLKQQIWLLGLDVIN